MAAALLPLILAAALPAHAPALSAAGALLDAAGGLVPLQPSALHLVGTVLGAAASAACESTAFRFAIATSLNPGFFDFEHVTMPAFQIVMPPPDHAHLCAAQDFGVAGGVCSRRAGLYEPMNLCVLCSSVQCWFAGGGQPFGAHNHAAANNIISIAGYYFFANGLASENRGWHTPCRAG